MNFRKIRFGEDGLERCARVGFSPFGSVLAEFGLWDLTLALFCFFLIIINVLIVVFVYSMLAQGMLFKDVGDWAFCFDLGSIPRFVS